MTSPAPQSEKVIDPHASAGDSTRTKSLSKLLNPDMVIRALAAPRTHRVNG